MNQKNDYAGTPEEVGARIASDALGPTIDEAAKQATDAQVCRMMAGMLAFIAGAVAQNFGVAVATGMLRGIEDNINAQSEQLQRVQ